MCVLDLKARDFFCEIDKLAFLSGLKHFGILNLHVHVFENYYGSEGDNLFPLVYFFQHVESYLSIAGGMFIGIIDNNMGIKHGFSCINVCQVRWRR